MSKYTIGSNQNLYALLRLMDTDEASEIVLRFSPESEVYKNSLNLKTLKKLAEARGKTLKFEAENPAHKDYIDSVNGDYIEYNDEEINLEETESVAKGVPLFSRLTGLFNRAKPEKSSHISVDQEGEEYVEEGGSVDYDPESKKMSSRKRKLIKAVITAAVLLLFITSAAWAFFWYVPTAIVKISVDTKGLIKLVDVKASTSQLEVSAQNLAIPAFSVETSETDSQTIPTTGKKQVGDMAKGKVTITNKTDKKVEIKKGAQIKLISTEKESLLYKTTDKIEIDGYTTDPVTGNPNGFISKEVDIEATSFGDKYNLDDTEKFEVDDYDTDEVVGENPGGITGGSSKEVNVVSQTDVDALKRTLEEFMHDKVERALSQKLVGGQVMQESSVVFAVTDAKYSNQLDEETDNLSLEMTMSGKVLAYDSSSLQTLMKEIVKTVVPDSFSLNQEDPKYEVAATSVSNGTDVNLQVKLTSSITPKLDEAKIKEDLSGMSLDQAKSYLDNLNDVKGFEIVVSPNLPGVFLRMPQRAGNISIEVNR
mgnify:CR=1 FL=1